MHIGQKDFDTLINKDTCKWHGDEKEPFFNRQAENGQANQVVFIETPNTSACKHYVPYQEEGGSDDNGRKK